MKLKKLICWTPLLGGIGAGVTIAILTYITFKSALAGTNYGLWLTASFGSSVVVVFGYPDNEFSQPKNVQMYESNSVETQYLDYGSKTFSVMWGHADLFKRFTVLRGAVSRIRLPTISRVAQR